jgi:hypothetical protein
VMEVTRWRTSIRDVDHWSSNRRACHF